jgi:uncharacterized protein HemX
MFLSVLSLFTGPFKNLISWAAIVALAFSIGFGYLKWKEHEAANAALIRFNQQQLEIANKENEKFKNDMAALQKHELDLESQIAELVNQTTSKEKVVNRFILKYKSVGLDPLFNDFLNEMRKK